MLIKMLTTVANPRFVAAAGTVYDAPKNVGKELLARRDGFGKPICEVLTNPKVKPIPLRLNSEMDESWGIDGEGE